MVIGPNIAGHGLAGRCQRHLLESRVFGANTPIHCWLHALIHLVTTQFSRIEQLGLVDEVIVQHCVHALSRHLVVPKLHVRGLVLIIDRLKSAEVLHDSLPISLLLRGILVIVSFELGLAGLQDGVGLVAIGLVAGVAHDVVQHS